MKNKLNPEAIRAEIPLLASPRGNSLHYLDNAATTLMPRVVLEVMDSYGRQVGVTPHRGGHRLALEATRKYEQARARVARFVGADHSSEIIFTSGATEGINMIAQALASMGKPGVRNRILLTRMEHHSNLLPWQRLGCLGYELGWFSSEKDPAPDPAALEKCLDHTCLLVTFPWVSNVTGAIAPVKELAAMAHEHGALVILDASQAMVRMPTNFPELGADLAVFSAHKMLGPAGIGALWGRREILEELPPMILGGGMVEEVSPESATLRDLPWRLEGGSRAVAPALGFAAAAEFLESLDRKRIQEWDCILLARAVLGLAAIPGLVLHGPADSTRQAGIIGFSLAGMAADEVALALEGAAQIAVRSGHLCAQPLVLALNPQGICRASFAPYTTMEDVEILIRTLSTLATDLAC